jgi:hypothetical protein
MIAFVCQQYGSRCGGFLNQFQSSCRAALFCQGKEAA